MESVILSSPLLLCLYGAALFFCIFDAVKHSSGYAFSVISAGLFVSATVCAILFSAGLLEIGSVSLLFLIIHLLALRAGGEGKK